MKKILLMLALMLPCLGAWADFNTTWTSQTKWYDASYSFTVPDGVNPNNKVVALLQNGVTVTNTGDVSITFTYTSGSCALKILGVDLVKDNVVVATNYVEKTAGGNKQPQKYTLSDVEAGNYIMRYWVWYDGNNRLNDTNGNIVAENLTQRDAQLLSYSLKDNVGNTYEGTYEGWAGETAPILKGLYETTSSEWNENVYSANITFPFAVSSASTKNQVTISPFQNASFKYYVTGSDVKTTNSASVTNHLWEIYPSLTNGEFAFQIKNVATGKYISTSLENNTAPAQGNVTVVESEGTYFTLDQNNQFKVKGKNVYLSTDTSTKNDQYATAWSSHNGTKNTIALIKTVNLVTYILTDNAGNTYTTSVEGTIGVDPVFTGVDGYTLEEGSWDGNTYTATITFPFAVSSATKPNLTYIGQGVWTGADKKWTVVDGNVKVVNDEIVNGNKEVLPLGPAHWLIYPTLNGTEFTFKIQSVSTSKYVTANSESNGDAEATNTPITLTDNGTAFQFIHTGYSYPHEGETKNVNGFAYKNNNGTTLFITCNGENDNNVHLGVYPSSTTHLGSGVRFPTFNQFKVVIGSAGYTTVYAPFMALTNDMQNNPQNWLDKNEVEIYTISDKATYNEATEQNMVHLTKMTSYIPQNGAAILKGNGTYVFTKLSQENYEEYLYNAEVEAKWNANFLMGTSVNTYVDEDAYVLSAPDGVESIGLYKAELNKKANGEAGTTHFLNNAGKAYLPASLVETPAGVLRFNFGGTTAIESVLNNGVDANAPIYDLSGRRVMNAVKGGIYIQNGKKFIVK
ncbi:MAG: hypothetical protein IKT82_02105 [Bacteroidaceae bacterium]|nr:hypothetical protein [Bacteroidaceae bacterium]